MARTTTSTAARNSTYDRWVAFASFGGIAIAIITFIFYVGVTSGRISNMEKAQAESNQKIASLEAGKNQTDVALASQDKATAIVNTRLEVIQRDVATLLGRTERPAGGAR